MWSRLKVGAASLAVVALASPPLGMALGLGGAVLNEALLKKKVEGQRKALEGALGAAITHYLAQVTTEARKRLRRVYALISEQTEAQQLTWYRARAAALEDGQDQSEEGLSHIQTCLGSTKNLLEKLGPYLGRENA